MTPDQEQLLRSLAEASQHQSAAIGALSSAIEKISNHVAKCMAGDAVLTVACGALYAEVAKVAGDQHTLDAMLARMTAVVEANPDSKGLVLSFTDQIRSAAEAMGEGLGLPEPFLPPEPDRR